MTSTLTVVPPRRPVILAHHQGGEVCCDERLYDLRSTVAGEYHAAGG